MNDHLSAALVHDIVDEHAHICGDCPPSARRSVIDPSGLRSLIRQLVGMQGKRSSDDLIQVVVDELQRHTYFGSGECSCGVELAQPYQANWDKHRARAILTALGALGGQP